MFNIKNVFGFGVKKEEKKPEDALKEAIDAVDILTKELMAKTNEMIATNERSFVR